MHVFILDTSVVPNLMSSNFNSNWNLDLENLALCVLICWIHLVKGMLPKPVRMQPSGWTLGMSCKPSHLGFESPLGEQFWGAGSCICGLLPRVVSKGPTLMSFHAIKKGDAARVKHTGQQYFRLLSGQSRIWKCIYYVDTQIVSPDCLWNLKHRKDMCSSPNNNQQRTALVASTIEYLAVLMTLFRVCWKQTQM